MDNGIKDDIKKKYSKIVVSGNTDCCCMPGECDSGDSPIDATKLIGYDQKELESILQAYSNNQYCLILLSWNIFF